jgi:KDO2-lipid IV(A) lauroyltransferase
MNQLTPVHLGAEKMALKTGYPVVFFHIRKVRRGHYDVDIIPLVEDFSDLEEHEITENHVRCLETIIRETPHQWLWTHRRWKLTPRKLAEFH